MSWIKGTETRVAIVGESWCLLAKLRLVKQCRYNITPAQIVPGLWMDPCFPNGTMTRSHWTQGVLRQFLEFAAGVGVRLITPKQSSD